jgi:hypothetical protein
MKIQNFIFTWNQFVPNAIDIESKISKYGKTTVVNSNVNEKRDHWINLNDGYFAEQWNALVSNIDSDTDFIFHIQADATVDDFDKLYSRFYNTVSKYDVGIYSPNVHYTDHRYNKNLLTKLEENVYEVPNTDCTCWFINNKLINSKLIYDIQTNKIGYGADWYYAAESIMQHKYVLRDYTFTVNHPHHKNYDNNKAQESLSVWINEQSDNIKEEILKLMNKHEIYFDK